MCTTPDGHGQGRAWGWGRGLSEACIGRGRQSPHAHTVTICWNRPQARDAQASGARPLPLAPPRRALPRPGRSASLPRRAPAETCHARQRLSPRRTGESCNQQCQPSGTRGRLLAGLEARSTASASEVGLLVAQPPISGVGDGLGGDCMGADLVCMRNVDDARCSRFQIFSGAMADVLKADDNQTGTAALGSSRESRSLACARKTGRKPPGGGRAGERRDEHLC